MAYIVALRQAKIYPPRQAAAAADRPQIVDCGCRIPRAAIHEECSFSWIAAAAIHEMDHFSWIAVARGLRQCRSRRGCAAI